MKRLLFPLGILLAALVTGLHAEEKKVSELTVAGLRFKVSEGWTPKAKPRAMSQGGLTYKTSEVKGLDADFYHFGAGQGGSVEANIARWKGQFEGGAKEVETTKLADDKIDFLHLQGTFMSGTPFGRRHPSKIMRC